MFLGFPAEVRPSDWHRPTASARLCGWKAAQRLLKQGHELHITWMPAFSRRLGAQAEWGVAGGSLRVKKG